MPTATTPVGDALRHVQDLLEQLPERDKSFDKPWELRAFALAVAAHDNGQYDWSEFQRSLISSIKAWEQGGSPVPWQYYDHWLQALENVLAETGALTADELDARMHTVLCTPVNRDHHEARHDPVAIDPAR
ncbi:nitrile hydratase accessory protein [Nitriliruptor alkaliphilus]|uniref:nitrile hydratase accessory protein n=1 Tax=Nitriliruptor alkaliphilus TaxID=427918 RepID=UPI0006985A98|nr:nitrile hydratase accessory protein [Nitriliruptor alkaliphilus]